MKAAWLLLPLAAACVPLRHADPETPSLRWVPVEASAFRLDYPAGDGAVSDSDRVLVLVPATGARKGRRPPPTIALPGRVEVGEIFRIDIHVPRAAENDVRTFRVRCGRPGLRILDGDLAVTSGSRVTSRRAVADSAGPATFDLEEVGD